MDGTKGLLGELVTGFWLLGELVNWCWVLVSGRLLLGARLASHFEHRASSFNLFLPQRAGRMALWALRVLF